MGAENEKLAAAIVAAIIVNLRGRRGLRQEWDAVSPDLAPMIVADWEALVVLELNRARR